MRILTGRTGRRMFMGTLDEKKAYDWWKQEIDYHTNGKNYMLGNTEVHLSGLSYSILHQTDLSFADKLRRQGWGEGTIRMVDEKLRVYAWQDTIIRGNDFEPIILVTKEDKESWVEQATKFIRR